MSTEREKLQNDQHRVWNLFEQDSDDSELTTEIRDLLFKIQSTFTDLIDSEDQAADRYAYLEFCLQYIHRDQEKTYINLEYDIGTVWAKVVDNDDFPTALEDQLLTVIAEKKVGHVYQIQKMAIGFTEKEDYIRAIRYFQVVQERLNHPSAWNDWARCHAAEGNFANAVEVLIMGMNDYPDSALLACNRAYYLHKNKKNSQSLKELQAFIERAETDKYVDDQLYIYALKLKASIYRQLNMPLQALIEYSRLSAAGQCDPAFLKEHGEGMFPHVEALSYG